MLLRIVGLQREESAKKIEREFLDAVGAKNTLEDPFPLPNMRSVKETDFWAVRSTWSFTAEAYLGSHKIDGDWATVTVFFLNSEDHYGGGYAVAYFHRYQKERVLYYRWSRCDHRFGSKNIGRCLTLYTCSKCGHSYEIDSSD